MMEAHWGSGILRFLKPTPDRYGRDKGVAFVWPESSATDNDQGCSSHSVSLRLCFLCHQPPPHARFAASCIANFTIRPVATDET